MEAPLDAATPPLGVKYQQTIHPCSRELQKRRSAFMPWAVVDLSRGGGCPELTQNGFLRMMDDAFVDVLSGGQRHPWRVQLLPRRSNIDKLFVPV
jgi:hypothetical protein